MKNKKKAFTLTELLVVVIVIGVLSAAVLPKFSKVIETRKTTEAEELMASIRTEQEKRCALDKPYLTDLSNMSEIVKKTDTKNYQLTLQDKGVIASSKGNYSYNLQMPSYADGRICCDGDDCAKLNKNYPSCQGFTYEPSPDSCAGTVTPVEPEPKSCAGTAVTERACTSGCGTEHCTATCNTATGNWEYSAWDNSCTAKPAPESRECGTGYTGTQTRSAVCKDGVWEMGDWTGTCSLTCDMNSDAVRYSAQNCERGGHNPNWLAGHWNEESCSCECPAKTSIDEEGACISACNNVEGRERCEDISHTGHTGVWNLDTCSCDCPEGTKEDIYGNCVGCWSYYKNDAKKAQDACIAAGGNWGTSNCLCQCPQGSWWDRNLRKCVFSDCSDLLGQGWGQDIDWCTNPSPDYGVAGIWNPTECKCTCPYPYYHDSHTSKGCLLAPGYDDAPDRDCGRDDAECNGWDQDAWEDEQDKADWDFEQGVDDRDDDRDYDYDYDY